MKQDLMTLEGFKLLEEAQYRAVYDQPRCAQVNFQVLVALMIAASVVMRLFSADAFGESHVWNTSGTNNGTQADNDGLMVLRIGTLGLLGVATLIGTYFAKVPLLSKPEDGLGFDSHQKRIYQAISKGLQKSKLLLKRHKDDPGYQFDVRAVLLQADYDALGDRGRLLAEKLLGATVGVPATIVLPDRVGDVEEEVLDELPPSGEQSAADKHRIDICVDHRQSTATTVFHQSALTNCETLKRYPATALLQTATWLLIRGASSVSVGLSINHALHKIAQTWGGLSVDDDKPVLWGMLAAGVILGSYRAVANNATSNDKFYREARLLHARCQLKMCPRVDAAAAVGAIVPAMLRLFYSVNTVLYFGRSGMDSLFEQLGWAIRGKAYEVPDWLDTACIAVFVSCNAATSISTTAVSTYRRAEDWSAKCSSKEKLPQRASSKQNAGWLVVMASLVIGNIGVGLVAANSTERAWTRDAWLDPGVAFGLALVVGAGVAMTGCLWGVTTAKPNFSRTLSTFARCVRRKKDPMAVLQDGHDRDQALLQSHRRANV